MTPRRVGWSGLAVASVCLVTFTAVRGSRVDHLSDKAVQLAPFTSSVWTAWVTDDKVLYPEREGSRIAYILRDVRTGENKRLSAFDNSILEDPVVVSPDGRRVEWQRCDYRSGRWMVHVSELDGKRSWSWPCNTYAYLCWMSDSRRVAELVAGTGSVVRSVKIRCLDNPLASRSVAVLPVVEMPSGPPVITTAGEILGYEPLTPTNGRERVEIHVGRLGSVAELASHVVELPNGASPHSVVFAPQGDRILWVFLFDNEGPLLRLARRFGVRTGRKRYSLSVWISALDGRGMTDLGELKEMDEAVFSTPPPVTWLPSGKGFVYSDDRHQWLVRL